MFSIIFFAIMNGFASLNENSQCYLEFSWFSYKILEPLGVEQAF